MVRPGRRSISSSRVARSTLFLTLLLTLTLLVIASLVLSEHARAVEPNASEAQASGETHRSRPNVIVVMTDDQGYGDLSCHGNPVLRTPHLDRLHRESIRLTDFHVAPMCTATRGQLLSGVDAVSNGATNVSCGRMFIRRELPLMPDVFQAAGYQTGHFGKWHVGGNYPYRPHDRGFDTAIYFRAFGLTSAASYFNNDYFDDFYHHNNAAKQYPGYCTDVWFNEAMRWMKQQQAAGEPFFTYIATNAPHRPFWAREEDREAYRDQPPEMASFLAMISNIDDNMGRLRTMLRETGLEKNTLLIFLTDNGTIYGHHLFNAGMRGNKTRYYEGGHRVPCFIHWPAGKLREPGDIDELTQVQDLLPTLIDVCDLEMPKGAEFDGISLAPLLRGEAQPELVDRTLVVQYGRVGRDPPQHADAAVMWRKWRLVRDKELYNLAIDPAQVNNVARMRPDIAQRLREHYESWWKVRSPQIEKLGAITIGNDAENPQCLTSADWYDVHCDATFEIRRGPAKTSPWHIDVDQSGEYEISLRRWPAETAAALTAAMPMYQGVDGSIHAGRAIPIAKVRLTVGKAIDVSRAVPANALAATFNVSLTKGRTQLQTFFYDAKGQFLTGAYYVYVKRK